MDGFRGRYMVRTSRPGGTSRPHERGQPDGFQKNIFSELKKKYPECAAQIDEYLDGLTVEWSKLENDSAEKEKELFNQHKNEILEKSAADLEL